jgi:hypothetical protein
MKLIKHAKGIWQYQLNQNEADVLCDLLKKFPFTKSDYVKISRVDKGREVHEREKLLNESLALHRIELKKLAVDLLDQNFNESEKGQLVLDSSAREILLQILNDIRVGCWYALGKPEKLEAKTQYSAPNALYRNLMDLAAYFEAQLLKA